jgi:hypothetical protein
MRVGHRSNITIIMRFERQRRAIAYARHRSPSQPVRGNVQRCEHHAGACVHSCEPAPNGGPSFLWQRRFVARIRASCESDHTTQRPMAPLSLLGTVVRDKMMKTVTVQVVYSPFCSLLLFLFYQLDHASARGSAFICTSIHAIQSVSALAQARSSLHISKVSNSQPHHTGLAKCRPPLVQTLTGTHRFFVLFLCCPAALTHTPRAHGCASRPSTSTHFSPHHKRSCSLSHKRHRSNAPDCSRMMRRRLRRLLTFTSIASLPQSQAADRSAIKFSFKNAGTSIPSAFHSLFVSLTRDQAVVEK